MKSLSCDPCDHCDHLETIDRKAGSDRCVAVATILCFSCLNEKRRDFFSSRFASRACSEQDREFMNFHCTSCYKFTGEWSTRTINQSI